MFTQPGKVVETNFEFTTSAINVQKAPSIFTTINRGLIHQFLIQHYFIIVQQHISLKIIFCIIFLEPILKLLVVFLSFSVVLNIYSFSQFIFRLSVVQIPYREVSISRENLEERFVSLWLGKIYPQKGKIFLQLRTCGIQVLVGSVPGLLDTVKFNWVKGNLEKLSRGLDQPHQVVNQYISLGLLLFTAFKLTCTKLFYQVRFMRKDWLTSHTTSHHSCIQIVVPNTFEVERIIVFQVFVILSKSYLKKFSKL